MRAYDESYLADAREVLGEAFDCAANKADMPLQRFFELFVATGVADAFGKGCPRYVAGSSGVELFLDATGLGWMPAWRCAMRWPWRKLLSIGAAGPWPIGSGAQAGRFASSGAR